MLHDQAAVEGQISVLTTLFSGLWNGTQDLPVPLGRTYDSDRRLRNELRLKEFLLEAERQSKSGNGVEGTVAGLKDYISGLVLEMMEDGIRDKVGRILVEFSDAGDEFIHGTRAFDRNLPFRDIFQALRNLWIVNSMQEAFGLPVSVNPSTLAYSLLYTYSDNYLDSTTIPPAEKEEFCNWFERRLSGTVSSTETERREKISRLVGLIEEEYPRKLFPEVFKSLLAIHRGQRNSLQQRQSGRTGTGIDLLEVSVEKGGTSVVADAYVAKGRLTPEETSFAFGYGVFLQFIDDLQDVGQDTAEGSDTLFTLAATKGPLDGITNRLVQFLLRVLSMSSALQGPNADALVALIKQGSLGLILESIALTPSQFSHDYVHAAETFSPLGFEAIRDAHSRLSSLEKDYGVSSKDSELICHLPVEGSLHETIMARKFEGVTE